MTLFVRKSHYVAKVGFALSLVGIEVVGSICQYLYYSRYESAGHDWIEEYKGVLSYGV